MAGDETVVDEAEVMAPTSRALPMVRVRHELVLPIEADQVVALMERIEEIKRKVLTGDKDTLWLNDKGLPVKAKTPGSALYICRAGWDKMAVAFNVSVQMDEDPTIAVRIQNLGDPELGPDGKPVQHFVAMAHCRAVLPNGRFQDAVGTASTKDAFFTKGGKKVADPADVILKAQTVAMNRAVANLLGGSLSAEEMIGKERAGTDGETASEDASGDGTPERPVVPGEVRIGVVQEIKRGTSKAGKNYTQALVDCDGTVASGFLNRSEAHLFFGAIEKADPAWDKPDPAVGHRVACTLVQSGQYTNIGAWVPWTEDIDQPLPFGTAPSAPAAAVGGAASPNGNADLQPAPSLSEAEPQDLQPSADDEPNMTAERDALLKKWNLLPEHLPDMPLSAQIDYIQSRLTPEAVVRLWTEGAKHGLTRQALDEYCRLNCDGDRLQLVDARRDGDILQWIMRHPLAGAPPKRSTKGQTTLA